MKNIINNDNISEYKEDYILGIDLDKLNQIFCFVVGRFFFFCPISYLITQNFFYRTPKF